MKNLTENFNYSPAPKKNTHMKHKYLTLRCALLLIASTLIVNAQNVSALDEALGAGKQELTQSKPETIALWNKLLTALERGDFGNAENLANDFTRVIDYVEPYQQNFAATAIVVLTSERKIGPDGNLILGQSSVNEISSIRDQITDQKKQLESTSEKLAVEQKKYAEAEGEDKMWNKTEVTLFGISARGKLVAAKAAIAAITTQRSSLNLSIKSLEVGIAKISERESRRFAEEKNKISAAIKGLIEGSNFREAIALSNSYTKRCGQDVELAKLSQSAVNQQKLQVRAAQVAAAASKDAIQLMGENRLWDAKVEIERSISSVEARLKGNNASDAEILRMTQIEMAKVERDLSRKIEVARRARSVILESAKRDAIAAGKKFPDFLKQYPDFPDADADNLRLSDLKNAQVEAKFSKRIREIEEVINNDPAEAKDMIKRLIADNTDPDEVSVIRSRMSKYEKAILKQELAAIQSYLTKWNVNFAESLKKGENPDLTHTASLSGGVENLTRATSVQEGVLKQIDVLLQEKMDNVTKSQVVALQETAKVALSHMNSAKERASEVKANAERNTMVMIGAAVLLLVGGGIFFLLKKKKTTP